MEAITILISFFSIILTLLAIKYGTFQSKTNKKKIRWKTNLLLVLVFIFMLVAIIYNLILESQKEQKQIYDRYMYDYHEVRYEIENRNYVKATKKIDNILFYLKSENERIKMSILKCFCYLQEALQLDTNDEQKNLYLSNCIPILKGIQINKNASEKQINKANLLLGMAYFFLEDELYSDELEKCIDFLESSYQENSGAFYDGSFLLGMYYENKYNSSLEKRYLEKAMNYYEEAINGLLGNDDINIEEKDAVNILKSKAAYFYLRYAMETMIEGKEDIQAFLEKSINIYNDIIASCDIEKDMKLYCNSLKEQARCYCLMEVFYGKYAGKAYDNFIKFIYLEDENLDDLLIGSYIFLLLDVSEDDINMLLKRYNRLLDNYNVLTDIKCIVEIKFDLVNCYYILTMKFQSIEYLNEGKKLLQEIYSNYYDYYSFERKEEIDYYNDFFREMEERLLKN